MPKSTHLHQLHPSTRVALFLRKKRAFCSARPFCYVGPINLGKNLIHVDDHLQRICFLLF